MPCKVLNSLNSQTRSGKSIYTDFFWQYLSAIFCVMSRCSFGCHKPFYPDAHIRKLIAWLRVKLIKNDDFVNSLCCILWNRSVSARYVWTVTCVCNPFKYSFVYVHSNIKCFCNLSDHNNVRFYLLPSSCWHGNFSPSSNALPLCCKWHIGKVPLCRH